MFPDLTDRFHSKKVRRSFYLSKIYKRIKGRVIPRRNDFIGKCKNKPKLPFLGRSEGNLRAHDVRIANREQKYIKTARGNFAEKACIVMIIQYV